MPLRASPVAAALFAAVLAVMPAAHSDEPTWTVCFTPGQDCTGVIVNEIGAARGSILVQAYSFTSVPILAALKQAKGRGVHVEVIVDKTAAGKARKGSSYTAATYLTNAAIPVWVDTSVAIAHNKVMVIDGATVISGSFNFTRSAQDRNAENLLIIRESALAAKYRANWERRRAVSMVYAAAVEEMPQAAE
jgi:phosphatidylserine/phosphatidylglycerophosphate/cardiolipin synthase-like enzyme